MEFLELLIVVAMVFVNAVFAAYEIALASVSLARLQVLIGQGKQGAVAAPSSTDALLMEIRDGLKR